MSQKMNIINGEEYVEKIIFILRGGETMVKIEVKGEKMDYSLDGEATSICAEATDAIHELFNIISRTIDRPFEETVELITGLIKVNHELTKDD